MKQRKSGFLVFQKGKSKKAQITIFLIVAAVILILSALVIYHSVYLRHFSGDKESGLMELKDQKTKLQFTIESCIERVTYDGLKLLGVQGGRISVSPVLRYQGTSFWYHEQVNTQPTLNTSLRELEDYIEENVPNCLRIANLERQGINYQAGDINVTVTFARENVAVDVKYPVVVSYRDSTDMLEDFYSELDVRYRQIFEMAHLIHWSIYAPSFAFSDPLKDINELNFEIDVQTDENNLIYTIVDPTKAVDGEYFVFNFAAKFNTSNLIRTVKLHDNSNIVSNEVPNIIYSVDRRAQLLIMPGTTFSKNGSSVDQITVQQHYLGEVVLENVPMNSTYSTEDDEATIDHANITWVTNYPIYQFEPTGLTFNNPQRLVLFWDEDQNPRGGELGILYSDGEDWRPLQSYADYDENFILTDIPGFSYYTIADCTRQGNKSVSSTFKIDPGGECWGTLIAIVIAMAIMVALTYGLAVYAYGLLLPSTGGFNIISAGVSVATFGTTIGAYSAAWYSIAIFVILSLVGGFYLNSRIMYTADKGTITFTPTCKQNVTITEKMDGGRGGCDVYIDGTKQNLSTSTFEAEGGVPITIHANLRGCSGMGQYFCGSCKLKCGAEYR